MSGEGSISLPPPLPPPTALSGPGLALFHAGPARSRPFALSTPRVHVTGSERTGVGCVAAAGCQLLADLRSDAGVCAGVVVGPSQLRRELVGAKGSILETVVAAERVAGSIVEWRAASTHAPLSLNLAWSVTGDVEDWRSEGPLLGVRRAPSGLAWRHLLFHLTPEPAWALTPADGVLHVRASIRLDGGAHATLLAAAGADPAAAAASLAVLGAARAVEVRAERAAEALRGGHLALSTGVRALDDALPWASARVRGAVGRAGVRRGSGAMDPAVVRRGPRAPDTAAVRRGHGASDRAGESRSGDRPDPAFPLDGASEAAWVGLGALAAGDFATALAVAKGPLAHPLGALLLGWLVAWSGRPALLHERRVDALQAAAGLRPEALTGAERVAWRAALDAWIEAAECLGEPPWSDTLRARRETLEGGSGQRSRGLRLPVVGGPMAAPGPDASFMAALVGGAEARGYRPSSAEPRTALERALRGWAAYGTQRADDGFRLLRAHLDAAFEHVPGAWRAAPDHACWDHTAAAALAPAATLFGLLGARADAWYGRLRLAPRLPAVWARLDAGPIRVGNARVGLSYAREGARHTFVVGQSGGRIPLTLVFQPEVAASGAVRVHVDGEAAADVRAEPAGERLRVALQLSLDREREVRIDAEDAG